MDDKKKQKIFVFENILNILYGVVLVFVFLSFNRFGMVYDYYSQKEFFTRIALVFTDYFSSFGKIPVSYMFHFNSILCGLCGLGLVVGGYLYQMYTRKNYRVGEEHGSSKYADVKKDGEDLKDKEEENHDIILSKNMRLSTNTMQHFRNLNVVVFGGSGAGKTRTFVKPNLLQMDCNYVVTDPKGSLLPEIGNAFRQNGYAIKVLDLVNMIKSMKYNPFVYFKKPNDVLKFVNNLIANTNKQKEAAGGDQFWEKAETAFLTALCYFLMAVGKKDEQSIPMMMELIQYAEASEDETSKSQLDLMFEELAEEVKKEEELNMAGVRSSYASLAVRQYKLYKKAAGKTAQSILISIGVRMAIFDIPEFSEMLSDDELDLESIGKPYLDKDGKPIKTILFCIISDNDSTFTFMASILYQQLFEILYDIADNNKNNSLPIHTTFVLDEIANTPQIPDFDTKIATMRSRGISAYIILQEVTKFKSVYPKTWETIFGNCDTCLFLGANFTAQSTTKYISEIIGASTVDYRSVNQTKGSNGSWSVSNQLIQRPLLDPAEIGRLPMDECLVLIRAKQVFRDKKYDLLSHGNIHFTNDYNKSLRYQESIEEIGRYNESLIKERQQDERFNPFVMNEGSSMRAAHTNVFYVQG